MAQFKFVSGNTVPALSVVQRAGKQGRLHACPLWHS